MFTAEVYASTSQIQSSILTLATRDPPHADLRSEVRTNPPRRRSRRPRAPRLSQGPLGRAEGGVVRLQLRGSAILVETPYSANASSPIGAVCFRAMSLLQTLGMCSHLHPPYRLTRSICL
jgi:hypothetical protein